MESLQLVKGRPKTARAHFQTCSESHYQNDWALFLCMQSSITSSYTDIADNTRWIKHANLHKNKQNEPKKGYLHHPKRVSPGTADRLPPRGPNAITGLKRNNVSFMFDSVSLMLSGPGQTTEPTSVLTVTQAVIFLIHVNCSRMQMMISFYMLPGLWNGRITIMGFGL